MRVHLPCIATKLLSTSLAVMIFFAVGPILAQSCPGVFYTRPRANAVKSLFTPNTLLSNVVAYGEAMERQQKGGSYDRLTKVPKSFFKAFFKQALVNLGRVEADLRADIQQPTSVYKPFVGQIRQGILPRFAVIRRQIQGQFFGVNRSTIFSGGFSKTMAIGEALRMADEVGDLMNYQTTANLLVAFDHFLRSKAGSGYGAAIRRWAKEHYFSKDADRLLAFQRFAESKLYFLDEEDRLTGALTVLAHLESGLDLSLKIFKTNFSVSNYLPYLSWSVPNEWTQLVARSKRVHVFSYTDKLLSYDSFPFAAPGLSAWHDEDHLLTKDPDFRGSYNEYIDSFNEWLDEYRDFIEFFAQTLKHPGFTDTERYAAIHFMDVLLHERGVDHSGDLETLQASVEGLSVQFGEPEQLKGREAQMAELGYRLVSNIVKNFYQLHPDYDPEGGRIY